MLGGTITDNDSIDGKEKEEEEREEEVALVLGLCPKRRSKLPTREEYFLSEKKSALLFFCFFQSFMAFSPPPRNSYFNNPSASFHLSVPEISIRYGSSVACGRTGRREVQNIPKNRLTEDPEKGERRLLFLFCLLLLLQPFSLSPFLPS